MKAVKGKTKQDKTERKRGWWVSPSGMVSCGWQFPGDKEISKEEAHDLLAKARGEN